MPVPCNPFTLGLFGREVKWAQNVSENHLTSIIKSRPSSSVSRFFFFVLSNSKHTCTDEAWTCTGGRDITPTPDGVIWWDVSVEVQPLSTAAVIWLVLRVTHAEYNFVLAQKINSSPACPAVKMRGKQEAGFSWTALVFKSFVFFLYFFNFFFALFCFFGPWAMWECSLRERNIPARDQGPPRDNERKTHQFSVSHSLILTTPFLLQTHK